MSLIKEIKISYLLDYGIETWKNVVLTGTKSYSKGKRSAGK